SGERSDRDSDPGEGAPLLRCGKKSYLPLIRSVANGLYIVTVGIEYERAVVVRVIIRAHSRRSIVLATCRDRFLVKPVHGCAVIRRKGYVCAGLGSSTPSDPEESFGLHAIAGEPIAFCIKARDPERTQRPVIELLRPTDIPDTDRDMVQHARVPLLFLFEHDLRANAFCVCREEKPVPTFSDHALTFLGLPCESLQEPLDLAILLALSVGPFPDHLLLGAHVRDEALNGFGQIGHRSRGAAACTAFFQRLPQPVDRGLQFTARSLLAGIVAYRGSQPVFELGVEAVLRLARLQVEKAEDQRTRKTKQRG